MFSHFNTYEYPASGHRPLKTACTALTTSPYRCNLSIDYICKEPSYESIFQNYGCRIQSHAGGLASRNGNLSPDYPRARTDRGLSPKTVYTLIGRLVEKGALEISRTQGRTHWYAAAVTREDYRRFASGTLLERLYDNSIKNMVACFIKDRQITKEELQQLRQLLDEDSSDE